MTQRFMIARALLHHPSVLLFDEPFSGLDASAKQFVLRRVAEEQQNGKGIVITTHNTELGYLVGTRFFLYDRWRIGRGSTERRDYGGDLIAYVRGAACALMNGFSFRFPSSERFL